MHKYRHLFTISIISLACATSALAAQPVDLRHQPVTVLQSLTSPQLSATQTSIKQTSSRVDFNQTTHIRVQETYAGYPVWGSDAVVHVPHNPHASLAHLSAGSSMNGMIYQNLNADLNNTPAYVFNAQQADKALQQATQLYEKNTGIKKFDTNKAKKDLMVYVDKNNKAHWAFFVSFLAESTDGMPALPTYILDATSFSVYEEWNNIQTLTDVQGGGFGGNPKMGKLVYDGLTGDYPTLAITQDTKKHLCFLQNSDVTVQDATNAFFPFFDGPVEQFKCNKADAKHNNIFWDADNDHAHEAYSPANDALYIGQVTKDMYQKWYGLPVLTDSESGKPLVLKMNVHMKDPSSGKPFDNAFFFPMTNEMYFGDGDQLFYPLTSIGVGAHELSHGFTSQHSNLTYEKQSGGLNESFSDMAAQAGEFYSTGHNSWQIGPEIVIKDGVALRYMDNPTKDGHSIDDVENYKDDLNVHYTSGVFNKVFYLLGTASGWDTKKAFDVMVQANMNYWTANSTFADAGCGVVSAAQDLKYDLTAINYALSKVGIDPDQCKK